MNHCLSYYAAYWSERYVSRRIITHHVVVVAVAAYHHRCYSSFDSATIEEPLKQCCLLLPPTAAVLLLPVLDLRIFVVEVSAFTPATYWYAADRICTRYEYMNVHKVRDVGNVKSRGRRKGSHR